MKKATFFIGALLVGVLVAPARSAEQTTDQVSNPLALLPGMTAHTGALPAHPIAGSLSAQGMNAALPVPLVSEFTNYPNPVDTRMGNTVIAYLLAQDSHVTLTVYDLLGVRVRSWTFTAGSNGGKAGANQIVWDGTNEAGRKVSKGGYLAQMDIQGPDGTASALRKIGVIH